MIEFKKLHKHFEVNKRAVTALQDINLNINKGEIFGIIGKSGAGKSTLLRTINLLTRPNSGEVWVDGVNLTQLTHKALKKERQNIGMIFQHFNLLQSRTAFHNIALPLELQGKPKAEIKRTVEELLALIQLEEHAHHFPEQLSGGQQQRIAIARALATKPNVLLADEATSALDANSAHSILSLLRDINQQLQVTIVLITHQLSVLKHICHRAAVLEEGQIVECANIQQLFNDPRAAATQQLIQKASGFGD